MRHLLISFARTLNVKMLPMAFMVLIGLLFASNENVLADELPEPSDVVSSEAKASSELSHDMTEKSDEAEECKDQNDCIDRDQPGKVIDDSRIRSLPAEPNTEFELVEQTWIFHGLPDLPPIVEKQPVTEYSESDFTLRGLKFSSGFHDITAQVEEKLAGAIKELAKLDIVSLHVVGHTDNQRLSQRALKRYKDNQELSEARARSIANWLTVTLKLDPEKVTTAGFGFTQPIADNNTREGMSLNRRVELVVKARKPIQKYIAVETPRERPVSCDYPLNNVNQPFSMTLDGQPEEGSGKASDADQQRCTDVALANTQIRLAYNNLKIEPKLNLATAVKEFDEHWLIRFKSYSNYDYFIQKQEVRIFEEGESSKAEPIQILSVDNETGKAALEWAKTRSRGSGLFYRLRVYDAQGRFDETGSFPLHLPKIADKSDSEERGEAALNDAWLASYGNTHLFLQNIPLAGGTVTVYGESVPEDHQAYFLGQSIPVSSDGKFVGEQILPTGIHRAEIAILDDDQEGKIFRRNLNLKSEDWFYVALADITLGQNSLSGPAELLTSDGLDEDLFLDGRLAFYLKGKWLDEYRVTASADSQEGPLEDLFSNFNEKDPQSLLRRLEEENHYTVYGDDSQITEDAPTQGKFYFKVEDDYSSLMWGSFKSDINHTDLARINRGLYGANLDWNSEALTEFGEKKTEVDLFASEPDTFAANEDFRGTGGSLYYLKHQDITSGSETLFVEVRDKDSGLTLSAERLVPGEDYDIDNLQGRILLSRPLSSVSSDNVVVRDSALGGHPQFLVVSYEYSSIGSSLDDLVVGGRASHWLNDQLQLGVTAKDQNGGSDDERLLALDSTYRITPSSYIRAEVAQTEGNGTELLQSLDGGFEFTNKNGVNSQNPGDDQANAVRIESGFKGQDLGFDSEVEGHIYVQNKEAGYTGTGQLTNFDTNQLGAQLTVPVIEDIANVKLKADTTDEDANFKKHAAEINYEHQLDESWMLTAGVRNEDLDYEVTDDTDGGKTDGALQIDYLSESGWKVYGFAQGTLEKDDNLNENNRGGLGGEYPVTDKLSLNAEVSDGNDGVGALIGSHYQFSDASHVYLNYELDPDQTDDGHRSKNGQVVLGTQYRYSESASVYGEERYQHGRTQGLTQAYGIDYSPVERWIFGTSYEQGNLKSDGNEIDRQAVGLSVSYSDEPIKASSAVEFREDEDASGERDSWLLRNNLRYQVSQDWRAQIRADWAVSDASEDLLDAYYREFLLGFAYRPVANDRLNALISYNYLADLSPAEQLNDEGLQSDFAQRSHVIALDVNFDIHPQWTIGGKYANRYGKLKDGRDQGEWFNSHANLYIARVDWHLVKRWDVLAEARLLRVKPARDERKGALLAVHHHFGDNFKAGVGYNFTDFSDDLTNLNYDAHGWFLNIIGKM